MLPRRDRLHITSLILPWVEPPRPIVVRVDEVGRAREVAEGELVVDPGAHTQRVGPVDPLVPQPVTGVGAVHPEIVTFAYVDPGHQTDSELHSWGAAHGPLWDALRKKGRQVRVIGIAVENATVDRAARVLETWAAAEPGTSDEEGLTAKQEIKAIQDAMIQNNTEFFVPYGGERLAMKRAAALMKMPAAKLTEGVSIDDYSTWRAVRFADRDEGG